MTNHVGRSEISHRDSSNILKNVRGFDQPASLASRQVNLGGVSRNDGFGAEADTRQEHFHLFRSCILGLVKNNKRSVQSTAAHIGQRRNFNFLLFQQALRLFRTQQVKQSIVERTQIWVNLLTQISGKESQFLAGFNCRAS